MYLLVKDTAQIFYEFCEFYENRLLLIVQVKLFLYVTWDKIIYHVFKSKQVTGSVKLRNFCEFYENHLLLIVQVKLFLYVTWDKIIYHVFKSKQVTGSVKLRNMCPTV